MSDLAKIEAYLAAVPVDKRASLETLRAQIKRLAPDAHEYFTYGMPAFKLGKGLAAYAAAKHHCALYPMSSNIAPLLADDRREALAPGAGGEDHQRTYRRNRDANRTRCQITKARLNG